MNEGNLVNDLNSADVPLLSWDIFMIGYHRLMALGEDLRLLKELERKQRWQHGFDFKKQLLEVGNTIIVTNPTLKIVYASSNMVEMNGYLPEEVIGKTPKIFQGSNTTTNHQLIVRKAIHAQQPFVAQLVNYSKSGNEYDCHIEGFPLFNADKQLANFIAFERRA